MRPRRWEHCCESSPSVTPANSSRCCANTWWHCAAESICFPAPQGNGCSSTSIRCCARSTDAKQGASYGHTKIAGRQILHKGLSPLASTISTAGSAPVIAGMRLRAGKAGSAKGAGRMVAQAIGTARAAGASGPILVRGDSAYGNRKVVRTCLRAGAQFSLVMARNAAVDRAIAAIDDQAWTPVSYPGAVRDPDTGAWISDAEVAEIGYTAFASAPDRITARLVVRRVKDARYRDALFPVWRYHPFFTNTDLPVETADITHRHHAIIDPVRRSDRRAVGAHHLGTLRRELRLRAVRGDRPQPAAPPACSLETATPGHADRRCAAGSSTFRPASPGPNTDRSCTYSATGPGRRTGLHCGTTSSDKVHHSQRQSDHPPSRPDRSAQETLGTPAVTSCPHPDDKDHHNR